MKKLFDNTASFFVIGIIVLIIVPLPAVLLDVMLIFNITISLLILLITMYNKEPLEFSIFPSVLLITTLLRLALNISSTRLILGKGGEAGQVIKTFGEFVIGGNPVVGLIIFLIIVVVQFIVITKGSERVAEVAARFTLDAMPGKQMAIDADLNAGLINDAGARSRRQKIQREADFYGAMDGASKFVKGDAVVSIIIVLINILGGSVIGLVGGGKTLSEVMSIYTIATVGDGLVSQIPALLISTATGMIVTRAASQNSLSVDLSTQLIAHPVAIVITGGVLLAMCFVPGLPVFGLLLLGGGLMYLGVTLRRKAQKAAREVKPEDLPMSENEFYKNPENVYGLLGVDPIEMEFGYSLIPLVDEKKGGSFIDRVVMLRRQFAVEMGMVVPSVRLRDNMGLGPNDYVIKLRGEEIARGQVLADHFLAMNPGNVIEEVAGIDTVEPAFGIPARWVAAEMRETAQMSGYTIIDPLSVLVTHLSELIKKHAHELLGRREIGALLEHVRKTHKDLVNDLIPSVIGMGELQKVLCNLLAEQIPIRDMVTILETLSEFAPTVKDADILTEYVRQALRRTITRKFTDAGRLRVLTVNPELENIIMGGVKKTEHGSYVAIEPETMQKIASAHMREMDRLQQTGASPVVLTSPLVRVYYKKLLEQFNQSAVVLSFSEIDPAIHIQSLGTISVQGVLSRA